MQEFLLVIHRDLTSKNPVPSAEQMQLAMQPYKDWIGGIAAKERLVAPPKRWDVDGRVITHGKTKDRVKDGPFAEEKLSIGGAFMIKAKDYDEAVEIAKGCPIIEYGAIVEVRMAVPAA